MISTPPPTFALLIGINDYSILDRSLGRALGTSDLDGALNDLHSMAMLTRMMGVEAANIRVLSAPRVTPNAFSSVAFGRSPPMNMDMADASLGFATRDEIVAGLRWLTAQLTANPGSQGIIYYSGHSVVTQNGHFCLCPQDTWRGPATAVDTDGLADQFAVIRYLNLATMAVALRNLVGTSDPETLATAWAALSAAASLPATERIAAAARAAGVTADAARISRFNSAVHGLAGLASNLTDEAQFKAMLDQVQRCGKLDRVRITTLLNGDPFADTAELRNLVSFNRAFFTLLMDAPATCTISVMLETCLQASDDRPRKATALPNQGVLDTGVHWHYSNCGLPLANGQITLLGSCAIGQTSNLAVFDNRWHGAFTWAVVSILSQRAVWQYKEGRSFDLTYGQLCTRASRLLAAMDFEDQAPVLWSQVAQSGWPVFGQAGWHRTGTIPPVRVHEEIDSGSGGYLFEIRDTSAHLGWLVLAKYDFTVDGLSWTAGKDYWIWDGAVGVLPQQNFRLVKAPSGSATDTLESLIHANTVTRSSGQVRTYTGKDFQGSGSSSASLSGFYKISKGGTLLGSLVKNGDQLKWRYCQSAGVRMQFTAASNRTLPATEEVVFTWVTGQETLTVYGSELVDDLG